MTMIKWISYQKLRLRLCSHDIALIMFSIFRVIIDYVWLSITPSFPQGEGIVALKYGLQMYNNSLASPSLFHNLKYYFLVGIGQHRPPFLGIPYFVFYSIFGVRTYMELMVNSGFMVIGLIGIYKLGRSLFDKTTGLMAAILWSAFPIVLNFSKTGFFEFPLMCLIPWVIFCWIRSDRLRNRKESVKFGIVFMVAFAIKAEVILYAIIPFFAFMGSIIKGMKEDAKVIRKQLFNVIIIGGLGAIIALPWYVINYKIISSHELDRLKPGGELSLHFEGIFEYLELTLFFLKYPHGVISILAIIMFVFMIAIFFKSWRVVAVRRLGYLALYCIVCYVILLVFSHKSEPHLLPMFPIVAIMVMGGISLVKIQFLRKLLIGYFLIYSITANLLSVCSPATINNVDALLETKFDRNVCIANFYGEIDNAYSSWGWHKWSKQLMSLVNTIALDYERTINSDKGSLSLSRKAHVFMMVTEAIPVLDYCASIDNAPLDISFTIGEGSFKEYDYVIKPEKNWYRHERDLWLNEFRESFDASPEVALDYTLLGEFKCADGRKLQVYKNNSR